MTTKSNAKPVKTDDEFTIITSYDQIPEFDSEAEEAAFWDTHTVSDELASQAQPDPKRSKLRRSRQTSIRLDPDLHDRLKKLANKKGKGYQTLLKEFVLERLYEEEKREGLL